MSAESPSPVRSWKSLSMTYIAPKLGALAPNRIDWPAMATVCSTPGSWLAMSSMCRITCSVRSSEAASGSCTFTSR